MYHRASKSIKGVKRYQEASNVIKCNQGVSGHIKYHVSNSKDNFGYKEVEKVLRRINNYPDASRGIKTTQSFQSVKYGY